MKLFALQNAIEDEDEGEGDGPVIRLDNEKRDGAIRRDLPEHWLSSTTLNLP
jgi:hypothetical protein